jgi:hypothetical protein
MKMKFGHDMQNRSKAPGTVVRQKWAITLDPDYKIIIRYFTKKQIEMNWGNYSIVSKWLSINRR